MIKKDYQKIANHISEFVGKISKVSKFNDRDEQSSIDLFVSENLPFEGIQTFGTIGLSDSTINLSLDDECELRVEFIGVSGNQFDLYANVVSTCAFCVKKDHFICKPGVVYPNAVTMYYPTFEMKHVLFVTPFLWGEIPELKLKNRIITWLLLVPISDKELDYCQENGSESLEELFEEKQIDIFDINRKSVL